MKNFILTFIVCMFSMVANAQTVYVDATRDYHTSMHCFKLLQSKAKGKIKEVTLTDAKHSNWPCSHCVKGKDAEHNGCMHCQPELIEDTEDDMQVVSVESIVSESVVSTNNKPYYFYCEVTAVENLAFKLRLTLQWNSKRVENLRDENGNKIEFASVVEMLNYMSKRGWDLTQTYGYDKVLRFLFRKLVTSDAEAKDGLYFKSDL